MPLVRIDLLKGKSPAYRSAIGNAVYEALTHIGAPKNDRFQVINEHEPANLIVDKTYLGIERTDDAVLIQITFNEGRTVAQKQVLYQAIVDGLSKDPGLRPQDVFINLVEVRKENWSFGNGVAQYAS